MSENEENLPATTKPYELSVHEVKAQVLKIQSCMKELMTEGEHYGASFPGDTKKNLLKPGADKLCFMFRLRPQFEQKIIDLPNLHREIHTKCEIFHMDSGVKIAEGVGSCSTMESKYRWRNSALKCPVCGAETVIKGKEEYGGGFVCFFKKGGCGAKFKDDDASIAGQKIGKVENPDIADVYNTVTKISKKRAYVDATITACAASDIFSQDAEDLAGDEPIGNTPAPESKKKTPAPEAKKNYKQFNDDLAEIAKMVILEDKNKVRWFSDEEKAQIAAEVSLVTKMPNDDPEAKAAAMHTCREAVQAKLDLKMQAREALDADIDAAADEGFRDQQEELEM